MFTSRNASTTRVALRDEKASYAGDSLDLIFRDTHTMDLVLVARIAQTHA